MTQPYYVTPHYLFDHPYFDLDFDSSFFVLAHDPREALELWLKHMNQVQQIPAEHALAREQQIQTSTLELGDARCQRTVQVYDLAFDKLAPPQLISWDELHPQSFILKPFT